MLFRWGIIISLGLISFAGIGQGKVSLNDNWQFQAGEDTLSSAWSRVNIPHTWNAVDVYEDNGYYRGIGWYKTSLSFNQHWTNKQVYLKFEGVNQVAEIFLNGHPVGSHIGGYNAFVIDLTGHIDSLKSNIVVVKVDNSHNDHIIPLKGDFNFYGGIYRDVYLITENYIHFDYNLGADGVFVKSDVSDASARLTIDLDLVNRTVESAKLMAKIAVLDHESEVSSVKKRLTANAGNNRYSLKLPAIRNPKLWSPDNPFLYKVRIEIADKNGRLLDSFEQPYGLRYFEFTAEKGFFLNGKNLKLIGTNRHQDYADKGNALSNAIHVRDVEILKEMGGNFLRTAHYPQDPAVLQACDQLGILVSMEIPLDHEINDSEAFYQNCKIAMQEMIRQHYNHPSIIIWAYMNEMLLGKNLEEDNENIEKIVEFAKVLEELTRKEDPDRYTMIPNHGVLDLYYNSGLLEIPMIVGWNVYFGWYNDTFDYLSTFMAEYRKKVPDKPVMITEYGAGSDPRIFAYPYLDSISIDWNTSRFDFSIDYQNAFHQSYLQQFHQMEFLSGTAVWNLFDFGSYNRNDAVPHINSKGLVTQDRKPKDAYYIYKSWLSDVETISFLSTGVTEKYLTEKSDRISVTTNLPAVELVVNGESQGVAQVIDKLASWDIVPKAGQNHLEVRGIGQDSKTLARHTIEYNFINPPYTDISLNFGSCTAFIDEIGTYWIPDRAVKSDLLSGHSFKRRNTSQACDMLGTLRNIRLTKEDPLYQTGRIEIDKLNLPLEPGFYRVDLHFAKIDRPEETDSFEMHINGNYLTTINLKEAFMAKHVTTELFLEGELAIEFRAIKGRTILNAFQLTKTD